LLGPRRKEERRKVRKGGRGSRLKIGGESVVVRTKVKRGKEESKESREREWVEDRLEKV
jgi:hypothetical protein